MVHENLDDMSRVTTSMTYQKGAWVLHMLRQRMGDDRFWAGIRAYYQRFKDASASTSDFREVMEQASGQDLAPFLAQWLDRGGVPRLAGTWSWHPAAKTVTIELRQTQACAPFQLTVDVGIQPSGAAQALERVEITGAEARATFRADREPAAVVIDPQVRLLAATGISRRWRSEASARRGPLEAG